MTDVVVPQPIHAPWDFLQVFTLNSVQDSGSIHPFTCGNRGDGKHVQREGKDLGQLVATADGWVCKDCDYTQNWAPSYMASPQFLEATF